MFRTKNQYIRLIANCALLFALIFIIDLVLGNSLRHFYFKSKYGDIYHLTYSMDSTKADVIILGSSRAHEQYVPAIIEAGLHMTCFNTGMDGNYMLNNYAVYKSIIKRYTPQIVLMDIYPGELFVGEGGYVQLVSLLPYYKENNEIRGVILLRSKFERLKLMSKIYPFNSSLLAIGESIIKTEDINELKGYMPLSGYLTDSTIAYLPEKDKEMDNNKIKILNIIASDSKAHQIKLIFIQSPRYLRVDQKKGVSLMNDIAKKHGAEFWNYVNDTVFLKPEYFKDAAHMNDLGANEFTKVITARIKREIIYDDLSPEEALK